MKRRNIYVCVCECETAKQRERVTVRRSPSPPHGGVVSRRPWGMRGSHSQRGFGFICPRHPTTLGIATIGPKKGGPVTDVWTLWEQLPRPGERGAPLREVEKRAKVPRTHPLLRCRTASPGILRKAAWASRFHAGTWWSVYFKSTGVSGTGKSKEKI